VVGCLGVCMGLGWGDCVVGLEIFAFRWSLLEGEVWIKMGEC
jgi:hypothetical protein